MKGFRLVHALALIAGLLFLYVPIGILILYSFNASRLVTVWGGFSTQWYASLWQNQALKDAALLSLAMAIASATIATVLGTLAALALERARPGRAKLLFGGLIAAPMVMPEVITGLSLLLLFVALNVERGFATVTLAHATLTLCFVTMIVQARLA
ncbi:MAG: putrescine ABC transporter permease PotI, partial [Hyphomicrobiales bacterium]|nr:putrescine ABC transporter permease PotI [Hyphomicrobiales bacterium]